MNHRELLLDMFKAAIAAAQPALCVPPALPEPPKGRLIVIGAGQPRRPQTTARHHPRHRTR